LALIGRLDLLREQFDDVTAPEDVWDELTAGDDGLEDLRALRDEAYFELIPVDDSSRFVELLREFDSGEAAALAYAIDANADLVMLEELDAGRVARCHDRSVTGVLGVLLRAAERDRIDLRCELDRLRTEGFWISEDLYRDVLRAAAVE